MKIKLKATTPVFVLSFILMLTAWSCNTFQSDNLNSANKGVPLDVSGSWKIVQATRNEVDITSLMDFAKFKLNLNGDGTYSIDNYLPFIAKKTSGKWSIDDPVFPFQLFFSDPDGSDAINTTLSYPVTAGKRQIVLTFSPGCHSNTYSYTFEKLVTN